MSPPKNSQTNGFTNAYEISEDEEDEPSPTHIASPREESVDRSVTPQPETPPRTPPSHYKALSLAPTTSRPGGDDKNNGISTGRALGPDLKIVPPPPLKISKDRGYSPCYSPGPPKSADEGPSVGVYNVLHLRRRGNIYVPVHVCHTDIMF
jgi:hypothetical protein